MTIVQRFLTDFTLEGETEPVKNLLKIVKRYLHSWGFIMDIIPIIPFQLIFHNIGKYSKLFFLLKILRMFKGLSFFNVTILFDFIKKYMQKRLLIQIEKNPLIGEDTEVDHNKIEELLLLGYGFQILKLFIIIVNLSFYVGMFWLIYCDVTYELFNDSLAFQDNSWFIIEYKVRD